VCGTAIRNNWNECQSLLNFKVGNEKGSSPHVFDVGMDAFPFVCYGYCQLQKRMGRRGIAWIGQEVRVSLVFRTSARLEGGVNGCCVSHTLWIASSQS